MAFRKLFKAWQSMISISRCVVLLALTNVVVQVGCRYEYGPPIESSWVTPAMPSSEAGGVVAQYVKVFNSGDQDAFAKFIRSSATEIGPGGIGIEERISSAQYFYNQARGLDVYKVTQPNDNEVSVVARLRLKEQWRQMDFLFEGVPKKLAGIRIVPVDPPQDLLAKDADFSSSLDHYIDRQIAADQFSGVVLIARNDEMRYSKAFGHADKENQRLNTMDTSFNYASVGKMFTAVAIARLVEQGHFKFEDSLATVLPNTALPSSDKITVAHLMSHQSGFADFFERIDHFKSVLDSEHMLQDFVPALATLPLNFEPGAKFEYSNSNYIILGAIIERYGNQSYAQYLQEHIFAPAQMQHTSLQRDSNTAMGYTEMSEDGKLTPGKRCSNSFMAGGKGSAAGGGVTTADDMLKFAKALQCGKLVSKQMLDELLTPRVNGQRPDERYALGFIVRISKQAEYCGHSGGFPGVDAQFDINREDGTVVIVLCNYEAVGEPVARYAESLLERQKQ